MPALRYGFRIMRRSTLLSSLGLGRVRERAFFEDQATWEALTRAQPGVRAYLTEAGFGPGPVGGTLPSGWVLAGRDSYKALQARLRKGLGAHALTERPDDAFRIDMFMAKVPSCLPPKGRVGLAAGREERTRRGLWAAALVVVGSLFCGGLYLGADAVVGMPGAPLDRALVLAAETGMLELVGQEDLVAEMRADGTLDAHPEIDREDPGIEAMRESLESLRARQ